MRSFFAEAHLQTKDGEKFTLVCDFYTIAIVQGIAERNWDELLPDLFGGDRVLLIQVLYGLLRRRHEDITIEEAAAISFDCDQMVLGATVADVIKRACNFADVEEDDDTKKKSGGRSKSSAKSG